MKCYNFILFRTISTILNSSNTYIVIKCFSKKKILKILKFDYKFIKKCYTYFMKYKVKK